MVRAHQDLRRAQAGRKQRRFEWPSTAHLRQAAHDLKNRIASLTSVAMVLSMHGDELSAEERERLVQRLEDQAAEASRAVERTFLALRLRLERPGAEERVRLDGTLDEMKPPSARLVRDGHAVVVAADPEWLAEAALLIWEWVGGDGSIWVGCQGPDACVIATRETPRLEPAGLGSVTGLCTAVWESLGARVAPGGTLLEVRMSPA